MDSFSLNGVVDSIIYNKETYHILRFYNDRRVVKAKGHFYGLNQLKTQVPITLLGTWNKSEKYGNEFVVKSWDVLADTPKNIITFLTTSIPGFSDVDFVKKLVAKYGLDTYKVLSDPKDVVLDGVNPEVVSAALVSWANTLNTRDLTAKLTSKDIGFTAVDVQNVISRFGWETSKILKENPYRLLEIPNFPFAKADRYAVSSGVFSVDDPRRLQGAVLWGIQEAARNGHLFLKRADVLPVVEILQKKELVYPFALGKDPTKSCEIACDSLIEQKAVLFETESGMYIPAYYDYERKSAFILARMLKSGTTTSLDVDAFVREYERSHRIGLSTHQKTALELLSTSPVLVVAGLPGTGKTTVLKAIVQCLEEQKLTVNLMAPTGVASKRLATITGRPAYTVHRSLRYDGFQWGFNEYNRFITDVVVLDEASMMDQELFYRLLVSLRPQTRLILVGDDAQLPSVGPGNVLKELLGCPPIPKVRLTEIFRQSSSGEIVLNSHRINSGVNPDLEKNHNESEFRFVRIADEEKILGLIVEMASRLKAKNANFQVLSPKYEGTVGVNSLNTRLRDALNPPGPKEEMYGSQIFRQGDRLLVVKNDYKKGVYNGDVGKLTDIYKDSLTLKVHGAIDMDVMFDNRAVDATLRLAYAMTVHRCQGSEYDTVIIPLVRSQGIMLQRNLLYTAVTRARKRVWLLGEETAIQMSVRNNKIIHRNTFLSKSIVDFLERGVAEDHDDA